MGVWVGSYMGSKFPVRISDDGAVSIRPGDILKTAEAQRQLAAVASLHRGRTMTKRGSIELARELCVDIAGFTDEEHDWNGYGYGSIDVAEILSAEIVRLRELLTKCVPHVLAAAEAEHLLDGFTPQRRPLDDLADQMRHEFVEREMGIPLAWQQPKKIPKGAA